MRSLTSLKITIPLAFYVTFSNPVYIAIASAVFTTFWIIFNVFDQLLFFSPVVAFYLPEDAVTGFVITNITSVLMGILVAMNVYVIRNSRSCGNLTRSGSTQGGFDVYKARVDINTYWSRRRNWVMRIQDIMFCQSLKYIFCNKIS
jgi:hypothetical protein